MCDQIIQRKLYVGESHLGVSVYFPEDFDSIIAIEYGIKRNENQKKYIYHATLENGLIEPIENGFFIKPVQMNFPATNYIAEIRVTTASQHDYAIYFERIQLLKGVIDSKIKTPIGSKTSIEHPPLSETIVREVLGNRITVQIEENVFEVIFKNGCVIGNSSVYEFEVNDDMELLMYHSNEDAIDFEVNNNGELIINL